MTCAPLGLVLLFFSLHELETCNIGIDGKALFSWMKAKIGEAEGKIGKGKREVDDQKENRQDKQINV